MTKLSPSQTENARNCERVILRGFARLSQREVAERTGISETVLCRLKDERLEQFCLILAALDLKIVPLGAHVVTAHEKRPMPETMLEHYRAQLEELE